MPRPPLWYLKKVELFSDMSDMEIMEMVQGMHDQKFPIKHILYTPQERVENTYILKEGEVTLYQIIDGKTGNHRRAKTRCCFWQYRF